MGDGEGRNSDPYGKSSALYPSQALLSRALTWRFSLALQRLLGQNSQSRRTAGVSPIQR